MYSEEASCTLTFPVGITKTSTFSVLEAYSISMISPTFNCFAGLALFPLTSTRPISETVFATVRRLINLETFKNSLSYVEKFWKPDSEYYKDIKDLLDRVSLRVEKRKKRSNIIWTTFLVLFVLCAAIGAWTLWNWIGDIIQFIIKK